MQITVKRLAVTRRISDAVESLETKMEGVIGLKNKTSGISDAVKFLAAKVESISGLNNETSSIRDGVKSLEEKSVIVTSSSAFGSP